MTHYGIRTITTDDYAPIIRVVNDWWGGRAMRDMLPKLFFTHFQQTSFIIEDQGQRIGFLIGFLSQTKTDEAYIHFVGIHPDYRKAGLGRLLYEQFFAVARAHQRTVVICVTSPVNKSSIAFHLRLGFIPLPSKHVVDGLPYHVDYDGEGEDRVVFAKNI